jgi:hypothetical protein
MQKQSQYYYEDRTNKRGAGEGRFAILGHAERVWPAPPDRERRPTNV